MRLRSSATVALATSLLSLAAPRAAQAQQPARDSLRLDALQAAAERRDPRARQFGLLSEQSSLRTRTLDAERLPSFGVASQAQYQSDVATIPLRTGQPAVTPPPKDTYDASLSLSQKLYDPTLGVRRDVERSQLAESEARVRSSLFGLRQSVNEAFFSTLLLQAQRAELEATVTDLEAQFRLARERVAAGSALPSDSLTLQAELLRRRQTLSELDANRDAARIVLADLTGRQPTDREALVLPELAEAVARARTALDSVRARPEYEQFARTREVLDRQQEVVAKRDLPKVSAYARAGYGQPGLNPLLTTFDSWWLAGVRLEWTPWTWGSTGRDREVLRLQQQVVSTEEAAFRDNLQRGVVRELANIDRLATAIIADEAIIALRERVLREARLRFAEGVLTSAEYVDRETDALAARLARATRRVELAQSHARFLTSLGLEVR